MPKLAGNYIILLIMITALAGCTAIKNKTKDISMRGYVQEEPRVDQEISGPVGNWENAPMAEDPARKMTRKVYYLEVTKEVDPLDEAEKTIYEYESTQTKSIKTSDSPKTTTKTPPKQNFNLPSFDDSSATSTSKPAASANFVEYKVEKDDTLQKISMKFYNTNNKWPKIYEANKNVIKDPNFIKPGIVIRIPVE